MDIGKEQGVKSCLRGTQFMPQDCSAILSSCYSSPKSKGQNDPPMWCVWQQAWDNPVGYPSDLSWQETDLKISHQYIPVRFNYHCFMGTSHWITKGSWSRPQQFLSRTTVSGSDQLPTNIAIIKLSSTQSAVTALWVNLIINLFLD